MSMKDLVARSAAAMKRAEEVASSPAEPVKVPRQPVSNAGAMMLLQPQITAAEQRAEAAEAMLGSALVVPVDCLLSVPGRRRKLTDEQYQQLRDNLANNPLIQPVVVKRRDGGKFEVISGDNRLAVYRDLGRTEIEVTISSTLTSEDDAARAAFFANLLQPSLPDYEKYIGFQREMDRTGFTQAELAQQAGISKTLMSTIFSFAKLPPIIRAALEETPSGLSASGATAITLALEGGKIQQADAASLLREHIEKNTSEADLLRRVAAATSAPKPQRPATIRVSYHEGNSRKCELLVTPSGLRIEFKDAVDHDWIEAEVRKLLGSKYKQKT